MLAHSPSLPLVIDYFNAFHDISAEDEMGIILALKQRHRVRRVRLLTLVRNLQELIVAIDENLRWTIITILIFPETLQAPHLRHLALIGFALPIATQLLTTAVGRVTLCVVIHLLPAKYYSRP